jgi:acyl-[acyl-carrier-protein]-phospholipid O-acyltransferase / long-chain-fatty-acid--[acyl-carrier-protein] ligase
MKQLLNNNAPFWIIRKFSSFTYLNITQFLGALNDNVFKLLVIYFLLDLQGMENSATILSKTGAFFVLPFFLFSSYSGVLADRYSKRNIIVFTKIFELFITTSAVIAFILQSPTGVYSILFLIAAQSAIFGPSKYGILPEIVQPDKITSANGLLTSFTFLAIILGSFFASFIVDMTNRNYVIAAFFCVAVSIVGFLASLCIEYTPPSGSTKKIEIFFLKDIYDNLKECMKNPPLMTAILGVAFFLFLGAYAQLNIIPFTVESLHLSDTAGGYLFLLTAIGIGVGGILAGKVSGKVVELGIVPLAGLGLIISCYALDYFSSNLYAVIPLLTLLGLFGGIFEIPLDSFIQVASPNDKRGQILATSNFLSYFGVLLASLLIYINLNLFGFDASKGFTVIGTLSLAFLTFVTFMYYDHISRFIGMLLSTLHFKAKRIGNDLLPKDKASLLICNHTAWNDTLLILGAQRRCVRFFIQDPKPHKKWFIYLYKLLRIVQLPTIEPLENNPNCLSSIQRTLERGISVCIFVKTEELQKTIQNLDRSYCFHTILSPKEFPFFAVWIDKSYKNIEKKPLKSIRERLRVPASIIFSPYHQIL